VVDYGLANRNWDGVEQIGIDKISVFKGQHLTCVYQIDKGMHRLLWCGKDGKAKTLLRFFRDFILKCLNALNILDRFHIAKKLNEAVDEVRRDQVNEFKNGVMMKRPENLNDKQSGRLEEFIIHQGLFALKRIFRDT
jgi:transposase